MPVTTSSNSFIRTPSNGAGFYALFDHNQAHKPLMGIYYDANKRYSKYYILEPNFLHPTIGLYKDINADPIGDSANAARNEFESFLLHLYAADVFISDSNIYYDLDADMQNAGITSMYNDVNILDFMVLTQAKVRNYKQPDGTILDLMTLGYDSERPNLTDVPNKDNSLMKDVIKHVGLKGFVPYLYAAEGIDFDTFAELILFFYPDATVRATAWATPSTGISAFLKSKSVPMFTESQLQQLGLKA